WWNIHAQNRHAHLDPTQMILQKQRLIIYHTYRFKQRIAIPERPVSKRYNRFVNTDQVSVIIAISVFILHVCKPLQGKSNNFYEVYFFLNNGLKKIKPVNYLK